MSQNVVAPIAAASLGAPPRRHREPSGAAPEQSIGANGGVGTAAVGTSASARYGENEWEAREVRQYSRSNVHSIIIKMCCASI